MALQKRTLKIFLLIVLLGLTTVINHIVTGPQIKLKTGAQPTMPLNQAFTNLADWPAMAPIPLTSDIVQALQLDDYIYRRFGQPGNQIALYIGYYRTSSKVGASHDPLVCFQGQGWQIKSQNQGFFQLDDIDNLKINYSTMIAQRANHREFIIYWFQTNDRAANSSFWQKIDMISQRLHGNKVINAFVRINAPLNDSSEAQVRDRILGFMRVFYPQFITHISAE